ncbi:MAG: hypothetical protein ACFFD4_20400 [Candidatus Odinarchaeota archaeon]
MQRDNLLVLAVLGSIAGIVMAGAAGVMLMNDTAEPPVLPEKPVLLPFNERWLFKAELDHTSYHPGDNITLTVQLTCLIDHNVSGYIPGLFSWMEIRDSNNNTVWHPLYPPGMIYEFYEFHAGDELGGTKTLQLGTTEEHPPSDSLDFMNYWIPLLPPGEYHFLFQLPGQGGTEIMKPFIVE